jgi:predicted SAM-dependent methyltransferase
MSLMRSFSDGVTLLIGRLRQGRVVGIPHALKKQVKVNLGCGLAIAPDWINIDGSLNALIAPLPNIFHAFAYRLTGANRYYTKKVYCDLLQNNYFLHHNLSHSIPLPNNSVDFIFTSHFLEHLYLSEAKNLLNECFRVLKIGGVIRISVPDLEYAVSLYGSGKKKEMLEQYFFVEDDDSYYARHKYMYDFEILKNKLASAKFQNILRQTFQNGLTPDINILDNRPEDSLFVEAMKC